MAHVQGADHTTPVNFTINYGGGFWFDVDSTGALMVMPFNALTAFDAGPSEFVVTLAGVSVYVATYVRLPVAAQWPSLPPATRGAYYDVPQPAPQGAFTVRKAGGMLPPGMVYTGAGIQGVCGVHGVFRARWLAVDPNGFASAQTVSIYVGNAPPPDNITSQGNGGCQSSVEKYGNGVWIILAAMALAALVYMGRTK